MCIAAKMERGKRLGKFKWMVRWLSAPIFTRGVGGRNVCGLIFELCVHTSFSNKHYDGVVYFLECLHLWNLRFYKISQILEQKFKSLIKNWMYWCLNIFKKRNIFTKICPFLRFETTNELVWFFATISLFCFIIIHPLLLVKQYCSCGQIKVS